MESLTGAQQQDETKDNRVGEPDVRQGSGPRIEAAGSMEEVDNTNDVRVRRKTTNR